MGSRPEKWGGVESPFGEARRGLPSGSVRQTNPLGVLNPDFLCLSLQPSDGSSSREDLSSQLFRRNQQIRKLEAKLSGTFLVPEAAGLRTWAEKCPAWIPPRQLAAKLARVLSVHPKRACWVARLKSHHRPA